MLLDSFLTWLDSKDFYLTIITIVLGVILVISVLILLLRKYYYKSKQKKNNKGLKIIPQYNKKRFLFFPFKTRAEKEIEEITGNLRKIIGDEQELKEKERIITKRIEELYFKTKSVAEESPEFDFTKKKGVKNKSGKNKVGKSGEEDNSLDSETKKVLKITDDLLEKLPEEVIEQFINSDDFKVYQKVVSKAKGK